jgi:hypothetical protein
MAKGVAASGSTLTLIQGALKIMAWTKVKTTVVAGAILVLAAGTTTVIVNNSVHHSQVKMQPNPATEDPFQRESIVRLTQGKQWTMAFIMFANRHHNQLPQNFEQLKTHASKDGLSDANWEIVSGGDWKSFANPSQTILLREKEPRQSPDGKFVKAYAFADGHSQLISSPDGDFAAMENKFGFLVQPAKP